MAEPPSGWTVPNDPDPEPEPPTPNPAPAPPASPPPATGWEPPTPGRQPPGWGLPPAPPSQWGGQPQQAPWGVPPPQPGGPPPASGQPQWRGQPGQPMPGNWSHGAWSTRGPGIVPLRPLAVGEILDGSIRAIRANPRTMVGFSAIVIAILTLLATGPQAAFLSTYLNSPLLDAGSGDHADFSDVTDLAGAGGLAALVAVLQFVLATTIISGLLIVAVDGAVRGQTLHPAQLWARCRPKLLSVLGLACLVLLALPVVLLITMLPGLIVVFLPGARVVGVVLLVLGALVGLVLYAALYLGYLAVAAPALLLENLGIFAAVRRSYQLVRGTFWRVFGIALLTAVIADIVRQVFTVPFSLVGSLFLGFRDNQGFSGALIQLLITDIGTILAGAVLFPFTAGVAALLYLDLRMRREGLDVDLMRQ
jgi:hypothetical protein